MSETKEKIKNEPRELQELQRAVEVVNDVDEKIRRVLAFMRQALKSEPRARLDLYWKGRTLCLDLFKESMAPPTRAVLWGEYTELMQEAKRLKEHFDEKASFATEQIELALKDLEASLKKWEALLAQAEGIEFPKFALVKWGEKGEQIKQKQKEVQLLSAFAERVVSLRSELQVTEAPFKQKKGLFERLSACGEAIFPKKGALVKELSSLFLDGVEQFVEHSFRAPSKEKEARILDLRSEIQSFQELAKRLALVPKDFARARKELSFAWDTLKEKEKERKKESAEKRSLFKQNFDAIMEKIASFKERCVQEGATGDAAEKGAQAILAEMKEKELSRDDVNKLKDILEEAKHPLLERQRKEEEERKRAKRAEKERLQEKKKAFFQALVGAKVNCSELSFEEGQALCARLKEEMKESTCSKVERIKVERDLRDICEVVHQKQLQEALQERGDLHALKSLFERWHALRKECKALVEDLRKGVGASGCAFEEGMELQAALEEEKRRLERMDSALERIEEQMDELE